MERAGYPGGSGVVLVAAALSLRDVVVWGVGGLVGVAVCGALGGRLESVFPSIKDSVG